MRSLRQILGLSILAGMAIGIGAVVCLSCENKVVGSLLFACGLYAICTQGLFLFTGKAGYVLDHSISYLFDLVLIWFGNLIGTGLVIKMVSMTRLYYSLYEKVQIVCATKMADNAMSLFALGILCGLLMYVAVDGYKKTNNPLILFVPVSVFILSGFEHCIADMSYFWLAGCMNVQGFWILFVVTLGNALGCVCIPLVMRFCQQKG